MKHGLAFFLIVTLMASVLAGAISVCSVSADTPSDEDTLLFSDLISFLSSTNAFSQADLDAFSDYVGPKIVDTEENEHYLVVIITDNGSCVINLYMLDNRNGTWCTEGPSQGIYGIGGTNNHYNNYCLASLRYNANNSQYNFCYYQTNVFTQSYYRTFTPYSFTATDNEKYRVVGTPYDFAINGRHVYCSRDVPAGTFNWGTPYTLVKNLFLNNPGPLGIQLTSFFIGIQQFFTITDQAFVRAYKDYPFGNTDGTSSFITCAYFVEDQDDYLSTMLKWSDLIEISNIDYYSNDLTNLDASGNGYAWRADPSWFAIALFTVHYHLTGNDYITTAQATNTPFYLINTDFLDRADEQLNDAWNQFNTYYETYNSTHVIPEQLGDWLFETNGSKLFPCSVQVPTHIWYDAFSTTSAPDNHIWRWGGTLIQEEGFQYSLFDTVIVGESDTGYGIRYFYDDTLTPSYNYIDEMLFENLIDSFDVVIIVPESEGILYEFPNPNLGPIGYTGSSAAGVVYTNDTLVGNTLQGFCLLTERAIAKQQLWNFNEGFTKLYELEVDYIDSEDKWKDSFLLWSASMFDIVNTLDGRLSSINEILTSISASIESIKTAVETLASDPDPDDVKPWYLSLWLFMKQFEPSNAQISDGLGYLVDNIDDIPMLPALTPVPALPTPGGG